jgi:hypothetical protein
MARKRGGKNNAITHGAYAEYPFLPDENADEFLQLHQGLIEEWKPTGALEGDTVLTLAQCIWAKRRVDRLYYREVTWAQEYPGDQVLVYVGTLADKLDGTQTFESVTEVISRLPELYKKWIERIVPRSEFKDEKSWGQSVKSGILYLRMQHDMFINENIQSLAFEAEIAAQVRELTSEKIAQDDRVDARIDKAIKRLAQLKAFKQIEAEQASRARTIDQHSIANHRPQTSTN